MSNEICRNKNDNLPKDVMDMLKWKLKIDYNDILSVEEYNKAYTDICGGTEQTDVLYSFLGIYALGVCAYNSEKITKECVRNNRVPDISRQHLYSSRFLYAIQENVDCVTKDTGMDDDRVNKIKTLNLDVSELNENDELKKFIENYFSLGNLIPIWPGGNRLKGQLRLFDIPELFFSKYSGWYDLLLEKSTDYAFLDEFDEHFKTNISNYKSLDTFLDSISSKDKEKYKDKYKEYLKHVNKIIINRTKLIEKLLEKV